MYLPWAVKSFSHYCIINRRRNDPLVRLLKLVGKEIEHKAHQITYCCMVSKERWCFFLIYHSWWATPLGSLRKIRWQLKNILVFRILQPRAFFGSVLPCRNYSCSWLFCMEMNALIRTVILTLFFILVVLTEIKMLVTRQTTREKKSLLCSGPSDIAKILNFLKEFDTPTTPYLKQCNQHF